MRTFKAFSNPEIFITDTVEPCSSSTQSQLINFKNDLNDFCRIVNFIRRDKRWIAVINPSEMIKKMLNNVDLDTKQIIMVYPNDKTKSIDIVCRALACGNCAAVISKLDDISSNDYTRLKNAALNGDSIAYMISESSVAPSPSKINNSTVSNSNELSFNTEPKIPTSSDKSFVKSGNVVKFSKKRGDCQSSFEF